MANADRQTIPEAVLRSDPMEMKFANRERDLEQRLADLRQRRDEYRRLVAAGLANRESQSSEDYLAERRRAEQGRAAEEREFQERQKRLAAEVDARERDQRREYERFLEREYS
jgi:hypothetical protein